MEHIRAIRAVMRDSNGVPNCDDDRLLAARDAGLIVFKSWPSGHWQVTPKGREYLYGDETT